MLLFNLLLKLKYIKLKHFAFKPDETTFNLHIVFALQISDFKTLLDIEHRAGDVHDSLIAWNIIADDLTNKLS